MVVPLDARAHGVEAQESGEPKVETRPCVSTATTCTEKTPGPGTDAEQSNDHLRLHWSGSRNAGVRALPFPEKSYGPFTDAAPTAGMPVATASRALSSAVATKRPPRRCLLERGAMLRP